MSPALWQVTRFTEAAQRTAESLPGNRQDSYLSRESRCWDPLEPQEARLQGLFSPLPAPAPALPLRQLHLPGPGLSSCSEKPKCISGTATWDRVWTTVLPGKGLALPCSSKQNHHQHRVGTQLIPFPRAYTQPPSVLFLSLHHTFPVCWVLCKSTCIQGLHETPQPLVRYRLLPVRTFCRQGDRAQTGGVTCSSPHSYQQKGQNENSRLATSNIHAVGHFEVSTAYVRNSFNRANAQ